MEGHVLTNPQESLQAAGMQDGEDLAAVVQDAKISSSGKAFSLWCGGGNRLVTWGNPRWGADCGAVECELKNVERVQATLYAFAAILSDG